MIPVEELLQCFSPISDYNRFSLSLYNMEIGRGYAEHYVHLVDWNTKLIVGASPYTHTKFTVPGRARASFWNAEGAYICISRETGKKR